LKRYRSIKGINSRLSYLVKLNGYIKDYFSGNLCTAILSGGAL
jgi:hypothetical protein